MEKDLVKTCIETLGLTVGYKHNVLLQDLNLNLNAGELVCFMGPNGVGKSTLIRTLAGLQSPLSGQIAYKTSAVQNTDDLPRQLAVVLTDRITAGNMTAGDVISFGRYPYLNWSAKLSTHDDNIISQVLAKIQIKHLKNKKLHELSDGQVQMVMIARAVVQDTPIILLDEPTAHLDLNNRLEIMDLLRQLAHKSNKAILVSTHELDLAIQTADIIWLAGPDKKITTGIPEDLILDGTFDSIFQFKGFDLKTGRVYHEPHRGISVHLRGLGHEYLWTKNALERNGFKVVEHAAAHDINIDQGDGGLQWTLNGEKKFTSLQRLLQFLASKVL
jgi:iron complex transport system ATP-binding protein